MMLRRSLADCHGILDLREAGRGRLPNAIFDLMDGAASIKGVMSADDAQRAADIGASAVIVSNHGGRQLDRAIPAPALGPKACSIGRPYLYGLGAGGEAGVTRALDLLHTELVRSMQSAGCPDLRSVGNGLVRDNHSRS
jgi:L-lactate dehydrogenase (cytochrome)